MLRRCTEAKPVAFVAKLLATLAAISASSRAPTGRYKVIVSGMSLLGSDARAIRREE
jgi:hypothetical protein